MRGNYIVWPWLDLLNSWVFHYECMECLECNRNRVSTARLPAAVREKSPRSYTRERWKSSLGHFLFMSRLNAILQPHSPSSELRSVLPWPQARSESIVRAPPEKREVRNCCSSDLFVFDLIDAWGESLVPPWSGFYTNKIIIFVVSPSWRFCHCVYVRKEKLLISRRACVQNFTAAVSRQALSFAYEISAQFCHS